VPCPEVIARYLCGARKRLETAPAGLALLVCSGKITQLYLLSGGSLAEACQACKLNKPKKGARWCFGTLGTAILALLPSIKPSIKVQTSKGCKCAQLSVPFQASCSLLDCLEHCGGETRKSCGERPHLDGCSGKGHDAHLTRHYKITRLGSTTSQVVRLIGLLLVFASQKIVHKVRNEMAESIVPLKENQRQSD